ncbi:MAG: long-chain-acyl-CoA synthetase [Bermanella sp.]
MNHEDVISWPQFLAKVPSLIQGLPGLVKGLKVGSSKDKTRPVGLGLCVEAAQQNNPDGLAIMEGDVQLSYTRFNQWANQMAHFLLSTGLNKGDTVAIMIENRAELLVAVTACAKIGVVSALINTSQRGKVLTHSINLVSPKAVILGEELLQAYEEVNDSLVIPQNKRYFLADMHTLIGSGVTPDGWKNLAELIKNQSVDNLKNTQEIYVDDALFYIYTSGTTGLPKAVIFNHGRFMKAYGAFGFGAVKLKAIDRLYVTLPFYHATAMAVCWGSVLAGNATLIMRRKFSASRFWQDVREYKATAFGYVGELCRYLMDQPQKLNDNENGIRLIIGNGLRASIWGDFKRRFDVNTVLELYASSEGNIGFTNFLNFDNTVGLSPFPYAIVKYDKEKEAPVTDAKGRLIKVKKGEAGLLIGKITDKTPFHGYTDKQKTEKSILRNAFKKGDAWFDTGDMMRPMGFRHAQFVDRLGDTFRWKGENVSTTEVELIVDGIEKISESIVYGVEIPNTNGRAGMASIRLDCEESEFDFKSLLSSLKSALPHYAVPVFLRISAEVDTTGTFKHKKAPLKEKGFDLSKQDSPVYVWLPKAQEYVPMCKEIQGKIEAGHYNY